VQISIRPTARRGITGPTIGMVVTDLTDALRTEELLRALARRVVQVQEEDRRRVALELHDGITQMLCALLFRSQALAESLSERDGPAKGEAEKLRDMAGKTAKEVERVAHNLRPSVLDQLGLEAAMRETSEEFSDRTGVSVKLVFPKTNVRLTAESELTLYRILQEALRNVEKHADARLVTVDLTQAAPFAKLTIKDDGLGFNPDQRQTRQNGKGGLGLVGMRERAAYVGGTLKLVSLRGAGTEIVVCIPMLPKALANN
jgi:signal transduction histidine kinase